MYLSLNFKGTKPLNMPRLSKARGNSSEYRGLSHRKLCIVSAVDEDDNMFFKIAGLGIETSAMIDSCKDYFEIDKESKYYLVSDMKQIFDNIANYLNKKHDEIKSGTYKSLLGNTLSEINQLHGEFKNKLKFYRGVSTRHLQGYLDFFSFTKKIKYEIEDIFTKRNKCLIKAVEQSFHINRDMINRKAFPVDISNAYPIRYREQQLLKVAKQY